MEWERFDFDRFTAVPGEGMVAWSGGWGTNTEPVLDRLLALAHAEGCGYNVITVHPGHWTAERRSTRVQ